jgi:DNA-binding GntR family transcriptional regulator
MEMDVSITPVREALLMLAQEGWMAQEPNRGFRVVGIRRSDTRDIYFMWGSAEGEIAARAARRVTAEDLVELRDLDRQLRETDSETSGEIALKLNAQLHDKVHQIADSPKLTWFAQTANRIVPFELWLDFPDIPGWRTFNQTHHTRIVEQIGAGDEVGAEESMRQHFVTTGDMLLEWLDSLDFWDQEAGR